jgi:hypothetical protein
VVSAAAAAITDASRFVVINLPLRSCTADVPGVDNKRNTHMRRFILPQHQSPFPITFPELLVTTVTEVSPSRFVVCRRSGDRRAAISMASRFCPMSSVRSTSDGRGPVTRKRVPDREEPGKPRKDARRGRCHPLEAGFWPLWMTPLPRNNSSKVQSPKSLGSSSLHLRLVKAPRRASVLWAT